MIFFLITQLSLADSLYENGYYGLARIEYERVFFFYPELGREWQSRFQYARAMIKENEADGVQAFESLIDDFPEHKTEARITLAEYYLEKKRYYLAGNILRFTDKTRLKGFGYLFDGQPLEALRMFRTSGDTQLVREINEYLRVPGKSMRTAMALSMVLPGAGEFYAGNSRQAVIDFLVNLGSGLLLYNALHRKMYVDAGLIFVFLVQRFYPASVYHAGKSAKEWNEARQRQWLENIKKDYFKMVKVR